MILNLLDPTGGKVFHNGVDLSTLGPRELFALRRIMQPVFQNPYGSLDPMYSIYRVVEEPLRVHRIGTAKERGARVAELLDMVALPRSVTSFLFFLLISAEIRTCSAIFVVNRSFFQEAPDQAHMLVELVGKMGAGETSTDDIASAKRVAHTLKGSGAIIGLRGLATLGHHFEDVLEYLEAQGGHVAKPVVAVLTDGAYCLEQMVAYVTGTDEYPQQAQEVLQDVLDLANRIDRGEKDRKSTV